MAVFTWKDVQPASSAELFDAMARSNAQATKAKEGIFDAITQYSKDRQETTKNQMMMDMLQAGEDPTAQQAIFDKYSQHAFAPEADDLFNLRESTLDRQLKQSAQGLQRKELDLLTQQHALEQKEFAANAPIRAFKQNMLESMFGGGTSATGEQFQDAPYTAGAMLDKEMQPVFYAQKDTEMVSQLVGDTEPADVTALDRKGVHELGEKYTAYLRQQQVPEQRIQGIVNQAMASFDVTPTESIEKAIDTDKRNYMTSFWQQAKGAGDDIQFWKSAIPNATAQGGLTPNEAFSEMERGLTSHLSRIVQNKYKTLGESDADFARRAASDADLLSKINNSVKEYNLGSHEQKVIGLVDARLGISAAQTRIKEKAALDLTAQEKVDKAEKAKTKWLSGQLDTHTDSSVTSQLKVDGKMSHGALADYHTLRTYASKYFSELVENPYLFNKALKRVGINVDEDMTSDSDELVVGVEPASYVDIDQTVSEQYKLLKAAIERVIEEHNKNQ